MNPYYLKIENIYKKIENDETDKTYIIIISLINNISGISTVLSTIEFEADNIELAKKIGNVKFEEILTKIDRSL